jgi:hypothetical protein
MTAASQSFPQASDLLSLSRGALMDLLTSGHPIDPRQLDDVEYRGISLGLPSMVEKLTWKKFKKVFHRDPATGVLRGWNVRMEQNGLEAGWVPLSKGGEPVTFGHYQVVDPVGHGVPKGCDRGLLIHYGLGGNRRFDGTARLRDPIVALHRDEVDLLLGWSYLDLGIKTVSTPSFFSLERDVPLTQVIDPPRTSGS